MICLFKWKMLFWAETAIHKAVCWKYFSVRELPLCRGNAWGFPVTGKNPERSKAATLLSWEMKKKKKMEIAFGQLSSVKLLPDHSLQLRVSFFSHSQPHPPGASWSKGALCRLCSPHVWLLLVPLARSTNGAAALWPELPSYELALPLKST